MARVQPSTTQLVICATTLKIDYSDRVRSKILGAILREIDCQKSIHQKTEFFIKLTKLNIICGNTILIF